MKNTNKKSSDSVNNTRYVTITQLTPIYTPISEHIKHLTRQNDAYKFERRTVQEEEHKVSQQKSMRNVENRIQKKLSNNIMDRIIAHRNVLHENKIKYLLTNAGFKAALAEEKKDFHRRIFATWGIDLGRTRWFHHKPRTELNHGRLASRMVRRRKTRF